MAGVEANKVKKRHHHDTLSLQHERRRLRKMRLIFGVFSMVLLSSLVISLLMNR